MTAILFYFFLCDRTNVLGESKKDYSRDLFMFLYLLLIIASTLTSLKKHAADKPLAASKSILYLNRLKNGKGGCRLVLFLIYHYFEAREIYNAIRVFIAAYVWMTGFGNFSYYYVRKDFSLGSFAQMMWRLNFLVFFACLLLDNDYMLYWCSSGRTPRPLCDRSGSDREPAQQLPLVGALHCLLRVVVLVFVLVLLVPGVFRAGKRRCFDVPVGGEPEFSLKETRARPVEEEEECVRFAGAAHGGGGGGLVRMAGCLWAS
ncbi:N-acetylneuraminate 9-O-acetyltransferase [Marchantia polymorpha subsp. ruderalis]|uniref:Cas1p 10 TM acyl transferase domain-containing protein n=2 Tax=Marchantia polymorpha TaxID=3197 RepID=A0AAF6BEG9_MARPO|nr:hypothetical protein MARPO_0310s0003 [Marchantia polymorpha]BBN10403.1 hypothetical protein Mp_5g03290 [Marchantia polymorpha subsp. ruderalis]|eukprot:PTQ26857.1 hypothetical protein MARPO_0310s0003 [Marchantia polymorpha]